jgi:hypothetical protein
MTLLDRARVAPLVVAVVGAALAGGGCGAPRYASARLVADPSQAAAQAAAQPLERSLFARDPQGSIGEDALQRLLAAPLELDLPARVGVLPVLEVSDWHGPAPDYQHVPAGLGAFVRALRGGDPFTMVTEMLPIPSGALGMEALRQAAARYALRYLVLYRERVTQRSTINALAGLYLTLVGALFVPGQSLEISGYLEASLFDVKTGLLLCTVRRAIVARQTANLWYNGAKLDDLQARAAARFSPELAGDLRGDILRFREALDEENRRRRAAAPGGPAAITVPSSPGGG